MGRRAFQFQEGDSNKFWTIDREGTSFTVQFGRTGTTGQTKTKSFSSEAEAETACAKLIAEKLKKGYQEIDTEKSTPVSKHDNEKLRALAEHLCPGDSTLLEEVDLAATTPDQYIARFATRLSLRGIEEASPELPWIALVDGLDARTRVAEIDWKEESDSIREALDELLESDSFDWEWSEDEEVDEAPTEEFLRLVGDRLYRKGISLAYIDIASDCYPLITLDRKKLKAAQTLAKQSGYGQIVPLRSGLNQTP